MGGVEVLKRPPVLFGVAVVGVVLADQLAKMMIRAAMPLGSSIPVVPGVVWLTRIDNRGAAFGLMQGHRALFIIMAAIMVSLAVYFMIAHTPSRRRVAVALGLAVGGALGNGVDRAVAGRVTDYIDVRIWPIFNIADSAIVVGMLLLTWIILTDPGALPSASESSSSET